MEMANFMQNRSLTIIVPGLALQRHTFLRSHDCSQIVACSEGQGSRDAGRDEQTIRALEVGLTEQQLGGVAN